MNISGYADRYGPWGIRRELIRQAVHDAKPDVLALQAVQLDPALEQSRDQASQMARIMPQFSSIVFQASASHPDGKVDGLAVLSRFEILESDFLKFTTIPGLEDQSQRTILHTRLATPEG
ncbi:MAG TPA: endonuclease/exonuclease/phosphatase family protein, partial [Anaerolineaceae bacterium]|nr:endonuclease/exonuclease/phosphatase family protein [Anaerolineaceae bacterium]